jgi:hypothetical protein
MTATSHAIIGTVIAAKIGNPALAIPIAIASHVVLDAIPHWDTATNGHSKGNIASSVFRNSIVDISLGFILSYFLIYYLFPETNLAYAFLMIIMSQLFDWLMVPYYFFGIEKPFFKLIYKFQKLFDNSLDKPWGIITQLVFVPIVIIIGLIF